MITKKIVSVLEDNGIKIYKRNQQKDEYYREIEYHSPAGENVLHTIWYNGTERGFVEAVRELAYDFDVDEHVDMYASHRGERGIPNSFKVLVKDAEWIEEFLSKIADKLEEILDYNENCGYNHIRDFAYEMYKIDWVTSHISTERRLEAIRKCYENSQEHDSEEFAKSNLEEWIDENGYDGEIYACYDEFCENEYCDEDYMLKLLKSEEMIANYKNDVFEILSEKDE